MSLKKLRTFLAAVMFIGITLFFIDFTGAAHHWLGWMAKIQFWPAVLSLNIVVIVALILLTLLFGRIYCSVICPLGILQDVLARARRKKNKYSYSKEMKWLRYGVLVLFLAAALLPIAAVGMRLLEPYSAFGRMATMVLQPVYMLGNNLLGSMAERADSYLFYTVDVWMKSLPVLVIAVSTLVVLAVLAWKGGRTYCNTICPVGTLLSLVSRFSLLKIRFDEDKCRNCSLCTKNCKASCIDFKNHTVDASRCVVCGDCLTSCKFDALKYCLPTKHRKAADKAEETSPTADTSKRAFMISSALLVTGAMAQKKKKVDGGLAEIKKKVAPERQTPLTPPGSLSFEHFAKHCTGCQLCVSECPNNILRPSADLEHLMLPVMSYEKGFCRPECSRCSEVCPTDAIRLIDKTEKTAIRLGHAVWIKKNCVVLTDEVECGNCARHCPTGAIEMVPLDPNDDWSPYVPAVNEDACIGCGHCEYVCPSRPFAAIKVEGHEVHSKR